MKHQTIIAVATLLITLNLNAQTINLNNPYPKTIKVNGSAELEYIPDEIYLEVVLREYTKTKSMNDKKDISIIRNEFLACCKKANVADSNISVLNFQANGTAGFWWRKRDKDYNIQETMSFQVKFSSAAGVERFLDQLMNDGIERINLSRTSHSKLSDMRKQLKTEAVKAAKAKAIYLAEAAGERVGECISINEPSENSIFGNANFNVAASQSRVSNAFYRDESSSESDAINFKKVKLRYEMDCVFSLK